MHAQAPAAETGETITSLWQSAQQAARGGDRVAYQRLLTRALAHAPQHPAVLLELARADARVGRDGEALALLGRLASMGFARFDPADSTFAAFASRPAFARAAARLAANRRPVVASDTAFTVAGPDRVPENVAYDPRRRTFYVGSLAARTVARVDTVGRSRGAVDVAGPADGLLRVVGMKVDPRRDRLWVATWAPLADSASLRAGRESAARLFAFDLATGRRLLALAPRDTVHGHAFNDLALAPSGDLYVTDTEEGTVWRVRAGVDTLERLTRPEPARANGANGVALSADGRRLYVAYSEGIARVDPATGDVRFLAVPDTATTAAVDGLYWHRGALVAVQMARSVERVVHFVLDPGGTRVRRAEVLERAHPAYRLPTTGAVVGDALYYLANPGWDRLGDDGTLAPATPAPTVVLRLPLRPRARDAVGRRPAPATPSRR